MADQDSGNARQKQPRNLQGLLKFCLETTQREDAPCTGSTRELSPERKEFLQKALSEMTGDPIQDVKGHIRSVGLYLCGEKPTQEMKDVALTGLEGLLDWCESYDMANDFIKIGGFSILHELITHGESELREHGFRLISVLVQNNPVCQKAVLDDEFLPIMLRVLDAEQDPGVQLYAVQAISCLIRDCGMPEAEEQFVTHNGFGAFRKVLEAPGPFRRVAKVAFFLGVLCRDRPDYKDKVCEQGIVELLAASLRGEHQQQHEQVMGTLLCLCRDHAPSRAALGKAELGVKPMLEGRLQLLQGKEEFQEERNCAEQILQMILS